MTIQKYSGRMMEWTSYIHNAIGLVLFWIPISEMAKAGLWNSVVPYYDRATAFWFILSGVLMWMLGRFMRWLTHEKNIAIPRFFGWQLLWVSAAGILFMPISGFWVVLPQAIYILLSRKR